MGKPSPTNLPASVHQRLLNLARRDRVAPNLLLNRFVIERFLFRLAAHPQAERFVLKGAMLFAVWTKHPIRPTRDLDLLGFGDLSDANLRVVMAEVCQVGVPADGVTFDAASIQVEDIRDTDEYHGKRVSLTAHIGTGRFSLQIDIGIGDAVMPDLPTVEYPVLLEFPSPRLRAYTRETVVAEKYQAMVDLGIRNSRMKDFFDLWLLAREFAFDGRALAAAVAATFARRGTPIPTQPPLALTPEFSEHPDKMAQWRAFLRRNRLDTDTTLAAAVALLALFLGPITDALARVQDHAGFRWPPGGPWQRRMVRGAPPTGDRRPRA